MLKIWYHTFKTFAKEHELVILHTSQGDVRWGCGMQAREILRCAQDDSRGFVILSAAKDLAELYG
jgi:hypothetical protein